MILLLLACGVTGEPLQAAPAPLPPPQLPRLDIQTTTVVGTVADVSEATRSWTVVGDGQRYHCVLTKDGRLLEGTLDISVGNLETSSPITMEGRLEGDVLVVTKGSIPTAVAPTAAVGPTDPALMTEAASAAASAAPPPPPPADPPAAATPAPPAPAAPTAPVEAPPATTP